MEWRATVDRLTLERRNYVIVAAAGALLMTLLWPTIYANKIYDHFDLSNYFLYSNWVEPGHGWLYLDVYSDYLLLANLLFAPFHWLAVHLPFFDSGVMTFGWLWLTSAWLLYWFVAYIFVQRRPERIWLWLAPSPLFYVLFRYEIYLTLLTLAFLFNLERGKWLAASLWLGLVIALKGYGLFLLPVYFVYLAAQVGWIQAFYLTSVATLPFIAEHVAVYAFGGMQAVATPYRFQANRPTSDEAMYRALTLLVGAERWEVPPRLAQVLQVLTALGAAAFRPRTFEGWLRASAFGTLGFIFFSPVTSPQFFLWFFPMIYLSEAKFPAKLLNVVSWVSFLDYPLIQFTMGSKWLLARYPAVQSFALNVAFPAVTVVLNALRAVLLGWFIRNSRTPETFAAAKTLRSGGSIPVKP